MENRKLLVERRKHERFQILSGLFAINSHFGQIIDISMGGLSFRYVDRGEWTDESVAEGTLFGDDDLWLNKIPIQMVSECSAETGLSLSGSNMIKRRGVQFGQLTPIQAFQLENFILNNTKGEVEVNHSS